MNKQIKPNALPESYMLVERSIWTEQQVEAATACITRLKGVPGMRDCDLAMAAIDAAQCKAPEISLADLLPAQQHQGEPVAWEQAVRVADVPGVHEALQMFSEDPTGDAGISLVREVLEAAPAQHHQGEPVHWVADVVMHNGEKIIDGNMAFMAEAEIGTRLYTHADPAEVERLRTENEDYGRQVVRYEQLWIDARRERDAMRTQLAEAQALLRDINDWMDREEHAPGFDIEKRMAEAIRSASAEPSAPVCETCNNQGAVGNILTAEPCPDCSYSTPIERETVEVEAYLVRDKEVPRHRAVRLFVDPSCYDVHTETLPLMTVAQHERIVAALERK